MQTATTTETKPTTRTLSTRTFELALDFGDDRDLVWTWVTFDAQGEVSVQMAGADDAFATGDFDAETGRLTLDAGNDWVVEQVREGILEELRAEYRY